MLGNAFGWPHLLIILAVVLLLFGATKLPALAKGVGQSVKVFRKEIKSDETPAEDGSAAGTAKSEAAPTETAKPADTSSTTADKP